MDYSSSGYIIEIVDKSEISPSELAEFKETQPLKLEETQEMLIQKYVSGEVSFPDYYTSLEDEDDVANDDQKISILNISQCATSSTAINNPEQEGSSKKRQQKKRTGLNPALQGLMGEANLSFVRGKVEIAEKICLEIIRQNPLAPEPFYTLAQIYEMKDSEKFLNFSTIAAHLDPSNKDQWLRIAEINMENKNYSNARVHYSRAIKYHPKDFDLRLKKGKLLELMGEERDAMLTYLHMIQHIPENMSEFCLKTAKTVAKYFYEQNKMQYALEAMKMAFKLVHKTFSIEDLNLYMQLLIVNNNYDQVILIMRDRCQINIDVSEVDGKSFVNSCIIPEALEPDLRVKLCVCLIHTNKNTNLLVYIVKDFQKYISAKEGIDWYVDFIDALIFKKHFKEALEVLLLVMQEVESPPALVWLRTAEVYRALDENEEAIKCYYEVTHLAPLCYEPKFTLSALLKQAGRHAEAVKALEEDVTNSEINPRCLYEKSLMLKYLGEIDEFLDVAYHLLARQSLKFQTREELITWSSSGNNFNTDSLKTILASRFEEVKSEPKYNESEANLSIDEEYELFQIASNVAYSTKRFSKLQKLCFAVATTKRFKNKYRDIEKRIILSCWYNQDTVPSFLFFREKLAKNLENNACWNFMNILIQKGEDLRFNRFLKRILTRQNNSNYLKIFLANYHMAVGSFKVALDLYVNLLKEFKDPLLCLCIGVCFSQIALQKNSLKKATGVAQSIAFLNKYSESRMSSSTKQEIYYNLGRIHHQSGILYLALHYYQMALDVKDELVENHTEILGLQQEIAFNMHLIYKSNGNLDMARKCLYKYCIV